MANTFKWSVQKLRVAPQQDDKTNVVIQADWLCVAMNEENNGKKCIEYNKDIWGQENYRRGCKTWA